MMDTASLETPEQTLAKAFARHVLDWACETMAESGGTLDRATRTLLERAAYYTSLAVSSGDTCLPLVALASDGMDDRDALRASLLASGMVAPSDAPGSAPLVLDGGDRLYLHRYFDYERTLAQRLATMRAVRTVDTKSLLALFNELFSSSDTNEPDWQKIAVALALRQQLLIVSGGPGTGKTTTVASLLACILHTDRDNRIMLAAPTGKAAARMLEAIRDRLGGLPPELRPLIPQQAQTIHRLLGMTADGTSVRYHADNPLPLDTLVIDEASMLDLAMAARLFDAVPAGARVILLGDKDQLAAVEAGSVFAELSAHRVFSQDCMNDLAALAGSSALPESPSTASQTAPLADSVVWLTRNYRFNADSGIGLLASDIRERRTQQALHRLCTGQYPSVCWRDMDDPGLAASCTGFLLERYSPYFECVKTAPHDIAKVFATFNRFRILCAVREGPFGVGEINRQIAAAMTKTVSSASGDGSGWFAGKPVMIRRNDYALRLFNGDVGIALPDGTGNLAVWFMKDDKTFRSVSPSRLGIYETSFAMTVHQSQGSEFDEVALLFPEQFYRVLCRELVYTGITRARDTMTVMAGANVLEQSLQTDSARHSGLADRLREVA